jgi:cyclophilin family peptidyl-prolyl cis-trans isomerase
VAANRQKEVEEAQKTLDLINKDYTAEMETSKGPIRLQFFSDVAPGHVKNFLGLAKIGYYNGLKFHRIIKGFMIQGGCPLGTGTGGPGYNIDAEFNETPHEEGVLSMARTSDPNSAGSQFFICLGRHTHLDRNYTAFGKVLDEESLKTVKALGNLRTGRNDQPQDEAVIKKVTVTEKDK